MPLVRLRALSPIIDIVRRFDREPEEFIEPLGIDIDKLSRPQYDDGIELNRALELLETVAEKTNCHYLGALIGNQLQFSFFGPIGLLMEHSPNVGAALEVMIKNLQVQQKIVDCRLETYRHSAALSFYPHHEITSEGARHMIEEVVFMVAKILRLLAGPDFRPDRICFAHAAPENVAPYRNLAMSKVSFGEEENAIIFNKAYLERHKSSVNDELNQALNNYLAILRGRSANDFLTRLDYVIQRQLRGNCCTLESIADEIQIHPRKLQRQLKTLGTSFRETLAAYRSRRASALLNNPDLQITQVAYQLGYSDVTAFALAFKKWFGKTPSEYREQHRSLGAE